MKIIVLHASALSLGYIGCYGNQWIATPNLDRLAAASVVFDQHYADTFAPAGGIRTCWTGRYWFPSLPEEGRSAAEESPSMPGILQAEGIALIAPTESRARARESMDKVFWGPVLRSALAALKKISNRENWLLWIDLPSLAPPWPVPEGFLDRYFPEEADADEEPLEPWIDPPVGSLDSADDRALERLHNTYAAAVTCCDSQLGRFLEALDQRALTDEVLLCFTADRGHPLGEHGILGADPPWPHEELIHLPLLLRPPGGNGPGQRIFVLTQAVDLMPTFLEAFGIPLPAAVHGHSLWPLIRGERPTIRDYACSAGIAGENVEWALRTREWAFFLPISSGPQEQPRRPRLYVKPDDRWEVNDLLHHHLGLAEHLEQTLHGFARATRLPGPLQAPALARQSEPEA